jgi:hypothetical protein
LCGCGEEILFSRRATCRRCRDNATKLTRAAKRCQRTEALINAAKSIDKVILHCCLANMYDAPRPCACRKLVSLEIGLSYVQSGRCVDFETRQAIFADRAILEANLFKQTPRGATIERAHIERALDRGLLRFKDEQQRLRTPEQLKQQHDDLLRRIEADKLARAEEEKVRWDIFNELTKQSRAEMTVLVPAKEFDEAKRKAYGVPALQTFAMDRRTCVGLNIPAPREINDGSSIDQPACKAATTEANGTRSDDDAVAMTESAA